MVALDSQNFETSQNIEKRGKEHKSFHEIEMAYDLSPLL